MSDEVAARYPTQSLMTEYSQPEEVLEAEWKSVPHCARCGRAIPNGGAISVRCSNPKCQTLNILVPAKWSGQPA